MVRGLYEAALAGGRRTVPLDVGSLSKAVNMPGQRTHPLFLPTIERSLPQVREALASQGHHLQGSEEGGYELVVAPGQTVTPRLARLAGTGVSARRPREAAD